MPKIRELLRALAAFPAGENLANPYATELPELDRPGGAAIRRSNLEKYLRKFQQQPPQFIIVGEAAGFQGCRFSGIAFTSEHTLAHEPFFQNDQFPRSSIRERPFREPSGSIVWETGRMMPQLPLHWNIVPFHPHQSGKPLTNRTPLKPERAAGLEFLEKLRAIFPQAQLIAAGRISSERLTEAGLRHVPVRHPAYGGKAEFQKGVLKAARG